MARAMVVPVLPEAGMKGSPHSSRLLFLTRNLAVVPHDFANADISRAWQEGKVISWLILK